MASLREWIRQHLAQRYPDLLRPQDIAKAYKQATGVKVPSDELDKALADLSGALLEHRGCYGAKAPAHDFFGD